MKGKKVIYTALFNNYDKLDFLKKKLFWIFSNTFY